MATKRKRETRPWSDLPAEILLHITKPLHVSDRTRLRAVCRGWRRLLLNHGVESIDKLPWTMEFRWEKTSDPNRTLSKCILHEPLHHGEKQSHVVEDGIVEGRTEFVDSRVQACRQGWVLLSKEKKRTTLFFFFNPFSREVIWLPELESESDSGRSGLAATFSSPPTSHDCIVFVAHPPESSGAIISISTYSNSTTNKTWKTQAFESHDHVIIHRVDAVAYMEGTFYCHYGWFTVASFKAGSQENWSFVEATFPDYEELCPVDDSNYLLEREGELLLVYKLREQDHYCIYMFRLESDWVMNKWEDVVNVNGGAIFLGKTPLWISSGGETERVADRIYYRSSGRAKYNLSYNPRKYDGRYKYKWIRREYEDTKIYAPCEEGLTSIWIQPPQELCL